MDGLFSFKDAVGIKTPQSEVGPDIDEPLG
jgi:hypothetical protein